MRQSHFVTLCCHLLAVVWIGLVFLSSAWAQPPKSTLLSDKELRDSGANSTLQVQTALGNGKRSYGSAIVWKKEKNSLIIATAYHVLKGATEFEVLLPQRQKEKPSIPIPSSKFDVFAEPTYDLVLLQLKLTAKLKEEYPWVFKVPAVTTCDSPGSKSGRAFGFPGFYKGRFSLYDPKVELGRDDVYGDEISIKYLNNSAKMKILHLTLDPTAKGMSGGPVIDKTGCFRGMVIGRLPDILGIAVNYKDISSKYDIADFKKFESQDFTEKTVFTALAEEHLSADDETVVNEVSWRNATDWGKFFDDFSIFRRQFQDIRINLEHYRYESEKEASLKLRKIGYERGEVSLTVNGEKVPQKKWEGKEVELSEYLCHGQNKISITKRLHHNSHQIWVNDFVGSNRLNLALKLDKRRIYRITRELPVLSNSYSLILYLNVDKLPANNHNKCQPTGTKNGQFAIRLPSLQKKFFGTPVKLPLLLQPNKKEAKKRFAHFDGCLKVGTKDTIQEANLIIKDRSRCESVCVNKEFGYVDFGLFSTLEIKEASLGFFDASKEKPAYKELARLVDQTMLDKAHASCHPKGKRLDNHNPLSFPLHYGLRLELLNNRHGQFSWMLQGTHADFLEKSALMHFGCSSRFFGEETDYLMDFTPYLPNFLMLWFNRRIPIPQEQDWFKWAKKWLKLELKSSVGLVSHNNDEWLQIDLQIGDVQKHQSDSPILDSEFASQYPNADVFVELKDVKMESVALGDLIPELPNLFGSNGLLNMSHLKATLTLQKELAAIGEKTDYCQDNEADSKIDDFGDFYGKLTQQLFRRADIEIDIKTLTSDQLKLKNATLSLSLSELSVGERLTGKVNGSLKQGIIELDGLRIKVPEQGIRFTIDVNEQLEEDFIQLQIQDRIPLHLNLPQGSFSLDLQPIGLAISKTGSVTINTDIKPSTVIGSQLVPKAERALPEPKRSFLPLSARIPVSILKELIVRQLPHPVYDAKHDLDCKIGDCTVRFVVTHQGDIDLNVTGNRINYSVPLELHAKWEEKFLPTIRPSGFANINLQGNSTLGLRENWLLASTTQLTTKVSKAYIHLKDPLPDISVRSSFSQEKLRTVADKLARELDKELAKINVKKEVTPIWEDLQKPRQLVKNPPLWLSSQLDQVYFGGLHGSGGEIKIDLALGGKLDGQLSDNPPSIQTLPLPPLTLQSPPSKHFEINLPLTVKLAELKQQLEFRLKNERIQITKGVSVLFQLQSVYGNGNQLVVQVGFRVFHKDTVLVKGNLFLSGKPTWNDTKKQLEVKQFEIVLDKTVDENNTVLLKQLAASSGLNSLDFPLQKKVEEAKKALEALINRKIFEDREMGRFYLQGKVNTLSIQGVYVQKEQVLILLNSTGQMEIIKK